jgi:hypothetical protein
VLACAGSLLVPIAPSFLIVAAGLMAIHRTATLVPLGRDSPTTLVFFLPVSVRVQGRQKSSGGKAY